MMQAINVNYLAVFVAAIASFVLGWIWHSPFMFGKMWMKLNNIDKKKIDEQKNNNKMGTQLFFQFVATVLMAYVLSYFIGYANASTAIDGAIVGIWLWVGFVATTMIGMVLWENKPFKLFLINAGHVLAGLIVMGAILAVWV